VSLDFVRQEERVSEASSDSPGGWNGYLLLQAPRPTVGGLGGIGRDGVVGHWGPAHADDHRTASS
jgi:hypothetical protein